MSLLNLSQQTTDVHISLPKARAAQKKLTRALHALVVFSLLIPNLSAFAAPTSKKAAMNLSDHPEQISAAISTVDDSLYEVASISSSTPKEGDHLEGESSLEIARRFFTDASMGKPIRGNLDFIVDSDGNVQ